MEIVDLERYPNAPVDEDGESFRGSVDDLCRAIDDYEALGIDHLIVLLQPMTEASLERLAAALVQR